MMCWIALFFTDLHDAKNIAFGILASSNKPNVGNDGLGFNKIVLCRARREFSSQIIFHKNSWH